MSNRGFALIGAVWLLVILIGAAGMTVAAVNLGLNRSRNRLRLARTDWAREACAEILLARYRQLSDSRPATAQAFDVDTVDLGRQTWCAARVEDPGARLNINIADSASLVRLLGDSVLVDHILTQRPLNAVNQLLADLDTLRPPATTILAFATTRGTGRVNLNTAPREVLLAALDLDSVSVDGIVSYRQAGRPITDLGAVSLTRSRGSTSSLQETLAKITLVPEQLVAKVVGGLRGSPLRSQVTLTLAPLPDRLAVLRRESE